MSLLSNLLSRVCPGRPARRRRARPNLLSLEDRCVPAGVVNATFAAGVLTLTALDDPTDVNITRKNHQNIILDGAGGNTITVIANNGETGTAFTAGPFAGVTSIKLVLGLGDDVVILTDATLTGTLTFLGGSGDNVLFIDGASDVSGFAGATPGNVTVGGVSVTNGDGNDAFQVAGGTHAINGNVVVRNGQGDGRTSFGLLATDRTSVAGSVSVSNLSGTDVFESAGVSATFTGPITVTNGPGGSTTQFGAATTVAAGGISVTSGAGANDFITTGSSFTVGTPAARGNLTIVYGTGETFARQVFNAATHTINGNLSITAARQNLAGVNGSQFLVRGNLTVRAGTGGSLTSISPTLVVDIDGAVRVSSGLGLDTLDFNGATRVDVGSVSFSPGNGTSILDFKGGPTTVAGAVVYTTLAGDSTATFDASAFTVGGAITATHGDGSDAFRVNGADFTSAAITLRNGAGGSTTVFGASNGAVIGGHVSVTNGGGHDVFFAAGQAFTLGSAAARRNLTIVNGPDNSTTNFQAGTTTLHGNVAVTNGDGKDTFSVLGTLAVTGAGNLTISNGPGGSATTILGTAHSIGGKLTVTAADGDDLVQILRLTMTGPTALSLGNGDDTVEVANSLFNGLFGVATGAGADQVRIENGTMNDGAGTTFNAAATINVGGGDDQVLIGVIGDADDFGDFNAGVTLAGGLDLDILQALANPANAFAVPPVVTGFEQGT